MSITIDDRTGSAELYPIIKRSGLPCSLGRISFGDICFIGTGSEGTPIPVGIEYKKVRDVLQCMTNGRFAGHQLPGLVNSYQSIYLLVEGEIRPHPSSGVLEIKSHKGFWYEGTVGARRFMYRDLVKWLLTMSIKGGLSVVQTNSLQETGVWLSALYNWWGGDGNGGWDSHKSHLAFNVSADIRFGAGRDRALLVRPSIFRRIAAELPGIGYDKSSEIEKFFGSLEYLFAADEGTLAECPGIGKGIAAKVWGALHR